MSFLEVHQETETYISSLLKKISDLEQTHKRSTDFLKITILQHENENLQLLKDNEKLHTQIKEMKQKHEELLNEMKQVKSGLNHYRKRAEDAENRNTRLEAKCKQLESDIDTLRTNFELIQGEKDQILDRSFDLEQKASEKSREIVQLMEENMREHNENIDYRRRLERRVEDLLSENDRIQQSERELKYKLKQKDLELEKRNEDFEILTRDLEHMKVLLRDLKGN